MNGALALPVTVRGVVTEGRRLGRTIGFPTANIAVAADFPLPDGVYAARVAAEGRSWRAMSNLGCNPSVGGNSRRLESCIFGFDGELYGRQIEVELLVRIRGERRFASVEELRRQIEADKRAIEALPWAEYDASK